MQERLETASTSGTTVLTHYQFDAIDVSLLVPFGAQTGLSLGLAGRGTMTTETRDADGGLIGRPSRHPSTSPSRCDGRRATAG